MRKSGTALCRALVGLNGFLAITAVAGGIGLLTGAIAMPVEMLAGSVFDSYVWPGLALMVGVGGTAIAAAWLAHRSHPWFPAASVVSGGAIIVFEIVEVLSIGSPAGVARTLQVLYSAVGLSIVAIATYLALTK